MERRRYLIINADDFGLSRGINRGIVLSHEHGIVTSASLMVRWPDAAEAASYGRRHSGLSLGLHFDIGEWAYRNHTWIPIYTVVPTDNANAVADELNRQLDMFRSLVGKEPTHLDSHQHVHASDPVRSVMIEAACNLCIPLRNCTPKIRYCGQFYGQTRKGEPFLEAISVEGLVKILAELPQGITELSCHPGLEYDLDTMYLIERAREVQVLCDPRVRTVIIAEDVNLCSFSDIVGMGCS
jgi:predicted glycoside hydrolase/deacetylase ChbG (UPF0249 family)